MLYLFSDVLMNYAYGAIVVWADDLRIARQIAIECVGMEYVKTHPIRRPQNSALIRWYRFSPELEHDIESIRSQIPGVFHKGAALPFPGSD